MGLFCAICHCRFNVHPSYNKLNVFVLCLLSYAYRCKDCFFLHVELLHCILYSAAESTVMASEDKVSSTPAASLSKWSSDTTMNRFALCCNCVELIVYW